MCLEKKIYIKLCRNVAEFLLSVCNSAALHHWWGGEWFSKAVGPAKVGGGEFV